MAGTTQSIDIEASKLKARSVMSVQTVATPLSCLDHI